MHRRQYLLAAGALAASATAGCLGTAATLEPPRDDTSDDASTSDGDDHGPTSDAPACRTFRPETERTVCVGEQSGGPVSFTRNAATVAPGSDFVATLANDDADAVGLNPHEWRVYRRDGDDWTRVGPDAHVEPWVTLDAGESLGWHVMVGGPHPTPKGRDVYVALDLEPGEHALSVAARVDREWVEFVAPFVVA